MDRRFLAFALSAALGAVLLAWSLAPDTGPELASRTVPAPVPPRQAALEVPAALPMPARAPVVAHTPDRPLTRLPSPLPSVDPSQVLVADLKGLATAAVARRDRFVSCWDQYRNQAADDGYDGRLTVKITVHPDGDRGTPETEVINGPQDPEFHDCMAGVLRDAKFESPGEAPFSMMWPVPIPGDTRTPRRDLVDPVPFVQEADEEVLPGGPWEEQE